MSSDAERADINPTGERVGGVRAPGEQLEFIRRGLDRYDDAFLAYLILDGVDQTSGRIVEDFEEHYAGWYPSAMDLMRAQVENLGWSDALDQFKTAHDIWPLELQLNWDRIWDHCLDVYDIETRLGGIHVFTR